MKRYTVQSFKITEGLITMLISDSKNSEQQILQDRKRHAS